MMRIHVICEGQTEETFVNEVLIPHFQKRNIYLSPTLIGKPGHKGGNKYANLRVDIRNRLLNDSNAYCTTFFDYYGLPEAFPGKAESRNCASVADKAKCVADNMVSALNKFIGTSGPIRRFIPYVQMHEFEALLFSDPSGLANGISTPDLTGTFQEIRESFDSPESINDNEMTAPSKRILGIVPGYEKPTYGCIAALEIGLDKIRNECPLFNKWLEKLETLS